MCINAGIYGISKDSADKPIFSAAMETQTQRRDLCTKLGRERVGQTERVALKHPLHNV